MTIIEMKQKVVIKFGENSFEAGYAQYIFSNRSTEVFIYVYQKLMEEKE